VLEWRKSKTSTERQLHIHGSSEYSSPGFPFWHPEVENYNYMPHWLVGGCNFALQTPVVENPGS
jgi:hypothetical protein